VSSSLDAKPFGYNDTMFVLSFLTVAFYLLWEIFCLKLWSTGSTAKKIAQKRKSTFWDLYTLQFMGRMIF